MLFGRRQFCPFFILKLSYLSQIIWFCENESSEVSFAKSMNTVYIRIRVDIFFYYPIGFGSSSGVICYLFQRDGMTPPHRRRGEGEGEGSLGWVMRKGKEVWVGF